MWEWNSWVSDQTQKSWLKPLCISPYNLISAKFKNRDEHYLWCQDPPRAHLVEEPVGKEWNGFNGTILHDNSWYITNSNTIYYHQIDSVYEANLSENAFLWNPKISKNGIWSTSIESWDGKIYMFRQPSSSTCRIILVWDFPWFLN